MVSTPAVSNIKQSDGVGENLDPPARPVVLTNCLPWGGVSKDGHVTFSNTCTIDNMLNIFFYLFLLRPLVLDRFRSMGSSFAIALTRAFDYFKQREWGEVKLAWVSQWIPDDYHGHVDLYGDEEEYFVSKLGDLMQTTQKSTCNNPNCPKSEIQHTTNSIMIR